MSQLLLWRRSVVARPAARAVSTPRSASRPATSGSASSAAGVLPAVFAWLLLFVLLIGMPIAMLLSGADPAGVLGWMLMVAVAMAISWFLEGRRQAAELRRMPKPRASNFPCAERYQAEWATTETCAAAEESAAEARRKGLWEWVARWATAKAKPRHEAPQVQEPVPCYVAFEGRDPGILEARPYTVVDALADTMAEADRLGLTGEDRIEALAAVIRGAKPAGSKAAARQSRGGGGEPRVGRRGAKGYFGGR
jgi:hypothetical protein